jgi:HK97 family phage portal protein
MSRILDAIGRLLPARAPLQAEVLAEAKASAVGPLIAWEPLGQPVWSPRDYSAFAREGFMQNAIVYRSVRMIAEAAASVPLLLYDGADEIEAHALLDLVARPSPDQTTADFLEAWYGFLLVAGNAYVEAVGVSGRLRELHVLRPDRMKVIPGADGWPEAFEYAANGTAVRFDEEPARGVRPILHTRLFHPDNDHYGMSPIEAAANAIDIHNAAGAWNKALLDNSARPSGALVYSANGGNLTGEQFSRLRGELESAFQGARNAGRPMLLEGGLDWKPLSLSPKDMDFIAAKHAAARDIALALGVPPMLLGIPGDNTFANYSEAQRVFWRSTVLPLVSRMAKAFSAWLAPAYGGGLDLRPDLDQVEGLSAEREALWARIDKVSFLTVDEKRAAVGYGPAESSVGAGDSPAGSRPPATFGGEETAFVKYSPDQPRVSAGNSGGGQWTDGGGGGSSGRVRVAQADTGARNDAGEDETQVAQARGGRGRAGPRIGENWDATPAQEARLAVANGSAQEAIRRVRRFDPEWRPTPSFVESAEGAIRRAEGEAREAEARVREIFRDALPNSSPEWGEKRLREETVRRGFVFREPTKKSPGQLFINPRTGEELRIMERPRRRNSNDEPQKHIFDYYYRYRKSRNDPPGAAIPIQNKSSKKDSE